MRNSNTLRRVIALATIVGALAAPAAWAAPFEERVPSSVGVASTATNGFQDESYPGTVTALTALAPPESSSSAAPVRSTTVAGDGFAWGDAGIGAAAMLALAAIAAGAAVVTGHRSGRQTVA